VVGVNDVEMHAAILEVKEMGSGLVIAKMAKERPVCPSQ
jgi:adenine deaminase